MYFIWKIIHFCFSIVFNLLTNTDVEATNEKVKRYQAENQQAIFLNQSKKAFEENQMKEKILNEEKEMQVTMSLW